MSDLYLHSIILFTVWCLNEEKKKFAAPELNVCQTISIGENPSALEELVGEI
jgi:hypothetical protein